MESYDRRKRARERVNKIKGFYGHLLAYVIVNSLLIFYQMSENASSGAPLVSLETFELALFWGIGLGFHALSVFGLNFLLGRRWEERQIRKYMEEDEQESRKYR